MAEKDNMKVNTSPVSDVETGTAEDVEAIMKKYDRESNTRVWEGVPKQVIRYLLAAFSLLMLYMNLFANWDERVRRSLFVGVVIILSFLIYPMKKGSTKKNSIPIYDIILMVLGAGAYFYFVINFKTIIGHATRISQTEVIVGVIGILILAETCRRVVGIPILCVATFFICYAFYNGLGQGREFAVVLKSVVYNLFYTTGGVIGTPIGVCSTYIALFILFGAFLEATGISEFFIQLANSLAGASTGGQIMPPIMGAAAFLMAEMVGVQYGEIAMRAIFPALLYFTGIFITVHLEAKRLGLKGIPKDELPKFGPLFLRQGYLLIPLVALVAMVMMGYTMSRAAIIATALAILVSMPNKETRMNPTRFINALEAGGKNTLSVAVACGVAGIIAGVVTMTGLGQLLISAIVGVAGDRVIVALFLTMLTCIVLGMGVPTTANYIIMATTCAPILVNGMGINKIAANMFVFYFGIVADITPPVALAAYAGSAIAKSNPMKTALNASRLAIAAFIVPYIFAFNPAMLFIDTGVLGVVTIIITSLIGLFGVAAGLEGYMFANLNVIERLLSIVGGLCLIIPGTVTDLVGIVLVGISAALQMMKKKKAAVA